ncbi:CocE/NonD family hydrolase [Actinocrispum wychmicini]|uniref:Putative CocE/NonD family hydrolase n=1 Tax=Actinocrispum wychmicini TaxID=1213861 RepID=A0A4R2K8L5_9PSEU|nr:CocE/NonD family hydrolase [Actinocrispum wychmicini]TCO62725.1 putative CocE/NonD family hydrolase [Actinocrispum wychmicini]
MLELDLAVPTRDGTALRGVHYRPVAASAPVVLTLTPYGADGFHKYAPTFASRGFHFVSLDARGRGDSDGEYMPFRHDGADGHDAVEWLARQPWCNGDVVTFGGSYCGFVQWAIAATRPPSLRAISPTASVYPGVDFPLFGNSSSYYVPRWLAYVSGRRSNQRLFEDEKFWRGAVQELFDQEKPFRDFDLVAVGRRFPAFQEWLDHPELADYWDNFAPRDYRDIDVPVLTITGQYDDDQPGALTYYDKHLAASASRHDLVIGPWDHGATRSSAREFGGLSFAESSVVDLTALQADWYDWVLGRGERPEFLADKVVYFHRGADEWRSAAEFPRSSTDIDLKPSDRTELFLDPRVVAETPDDDAMFVADTLPGLAFLSDPLPVTDITGRPRVRLTLSSKLPDFDLLGQVYLLRGTGPAVLLGEVPFLARYRESLRRAEPWPSDVDVPVELAAFPFISLRTEPDDRIAVVVRQPHRLWQVNYQTGGDRADESPRDAVAGTVRVVGVPELALPRF